MLTWLVLSGGLSVLIAMALDGFQMQGSSADYSTGVICGTALHVKASLEVRSAQIPKIHENHPKSF